MLLRNQVTPEKKKHSFNLNQVEQQINGTQISHEINYNASKMGDNVIRGMENQVLIL